MPQLWDFLSPIICSRREGSVRTRMESHPSLWLSGAECCLSCWKAVPEEGVGSERRLLKGQGRVGKWMRPRLLPRCDLRPWMSGGQELKSLESPRRWRLPLKAFLEPTWHICRLMIPGSGRSPGGGHGNPLYILAWRSPWAEEPGRLQSIGSHRVGHD